ncbi:hypothetical protein Tcan_15134 [Toxocara canis]|uniref:Uncharacterized protein n=1 Tax=Toxocara canis TaxID=6265 RepID=A0A0B2V865_TOXCA|nr:hypothetical protein Tcan_15134 [Toxocara canis]
MLSRFFFQKIEAIRAMSSDEGRSPSSAARSRSHSEGTRSPVAGKNGNARAASGSHSRSRSISRSPVQQRSASQSPVRERSRSVSRDRVARRSRSGDRRRDRSRSRSSRARRRRYCLFACVLGSASITRRNDGRRERRGEERG